MSKVEISAPQSERIYPGLQSYYLTNKPRQMIEH